MANWPIEVKFAQNLAANEKKIRDKSLRKLRKYLKLKSAKKDGFTEEDFLKLWKGLHFCLWMQDKPLIQEELCSTISKLVHDLQTAEARFLFLQTFFSTEAREWNSIDIWRIDKFMMLMRNVLHEIFLLAQTASWSDDAVNHLVNIIRETGLHHQKDSVPDGIRIHLADIYLDEMAKVANAQLDGEKLLKLLEPFCLYIMKAQNTAIVKRVISRVFEPIITTAIIQNAETQSDDWGETKKEQFSDIKLDSRLLADHLFNLSMGDQCLARNRPLVFNIIKRLQDVEEGVVPEDDKIIVKPSLTHQDYSDAIETLTKLQDNESRNKKMHLKKKKGKTDEKAVKATEAIRSDTDSESAGSPIGPIKRKHLHDAEPGDIEQHNRRKRINCKGIQRGSHGKDFVQTERIEMNSQTNSISFESESASNDKVKEASGNKELLNENPEIMGDDTAWIETTTEKKDSPMREILYNKRRNGRKNNTEAVGKRFRTVIKVNKDNQKGKKKYIWAENPTIQEKKSTTAISDSTSMKGGNFKEDGLHSSDKLTTIENGSSIGNSKTDYAEKRKKNEIILQEKTENEFDNQFEISSDTKNAKMSTFGSGKPDLDKHIPHTSDDLQEGEIEIFIPNKKNKQRKLDETFAKFEKARIPAAFVKKALTLKQKQSPIQVRDSKKQTTPVSEKRVQFDMKRNKALAFRDSLQISPMFPFHPDKKPDQGILKSTPDATAGQLSSQGNQRSSGTSGNKGRSLVTTLLPAVTGKQKKLNTRARAADFFL